MNNLSTLVEQALAPKEADNIMEDATEEQLRAGRGVLPRDMTREEREERKRSMQRRRARQYRKRQERAAENRAKDAKALPKGAVKNALDVTAHLSEKIDLVAQRRARKAARLLGSIAEDATFETFATVNRSIAGAIHRDERPKEELIEAAAWLSREPGIPTVHWKDDPPKHASWLMSVIEYRSRTAIQDWYDKNPSLESLAQGDSAIASTHSDDYYDRFCAKQDLGLLGARWPRPGQVDVAIIQGVIAGAITGRGLDALVELILGNLRSDGLFPWTEYAEEVFTALGLAHRWQQIEAKATTPEMAGRMARGAARRALAFVLPAMDQATKMLETGYWVAPEPTRIQFTIAPEPDAQARTIIEALEALTEAFA